LPEPPVNTADKWAKEKTLQKEKDEMLDARQQAAQSPAATGEEDKWADLKKMKAEETGPSSDLKDELAKERKEQVILDASLLKSGEEPSSGGLTTIIQSLKDPEPWVRAQAARRLAVIHPAPIETIPTLIKMLSDSEAEPRRAAAAALGSFGPLAKEAL